MKKTIEVYDDLIDDETHAKVYEWCQSVSWYTRWLGLQDVKGKQFKPINEYIEISKYYSTKKSRIFINGLLDNFVRTYIKEGKIKKDDIVILVAFGAGFYWGSVVIKW